MSENLPAESLPPEAVVVSSHPVASRTARLKRAVSIGCFTMIALVGLALFLPGIQGAREAAPRSQCRSNLKLIGLALQNYHAAQGCFPPAYIADEDGRPIHSWRALILSYFDASPAPPYRMDEPWDGPNNSRLAGQYSHLFTCPRDHSEIKGSKFMTSYVAIVGAETAWRNSESTKLSDFKDADSQTIQIVEVANSGIHWMEPRDFHVSQMNPTINTTSGQGISSHHTSGAHVLFADGVVRFLSDKLPTTTIRALLTIRGGEPIPEF